MLVQMMNDTQNLYAFILKDAMMVCSYNVNYVDKNALNTQIINQLARLD